MPLLTRETVQSLIDRVNKLKPGTKGNWGKMSVEEMMVHCEAGIRMGLGEIPSRVRVGPVRGFVTKVLFLELFPFPKSSPSPAEINVNKKLRVRKDFDTARKDLIVSIEKMSSIPNDYSFPPHPIFHKLSVRQWRKLAYKHLNHHLKQFGV
jgi:hypothetical protein